MEWAAGLSVSSRFLLDLKETLLEGRIRSMKVWVVLEVYRLVVLLVDREIDLALEKNEFIVWFRL